MITAITFDFWDTIVLDDSDEPKRQKKGLLPKVESRKKIFVEEIRQHHPKIPQTTIEKGLDDANAWFLHCWKKEHHTPTVTSRLERACQNLGILPTPGLDRVIEQYETMEVITPPDFAPGIADCLRELSQKYALGIISDTIVSPGTSLQKILKAADLLQYFQVFVFSDEVGAAKPAPQVFAEARTQFQVEYHQMVHIGDREQNDILGPLEVGMNGILYTGAIDRGTENSKAYAICHHHDQLPAIIALLSQGS